jgi:uncharacterized protein
LAVGLAIVLPSLTWLSPLTFTLLLPAGALWIWKSGKRSFGDLGWRLSAGWLRTLAVGLFCGLAIPLLFLVIQVVGGWITLTPRAGAAQGLISYLLLLVLKMVFLVAIEELVFRGFFLQALGSKAGLLLAMILSSLLWGAGHLVSMVSDGLILIQIVIGMTTFLLWGIALSLCFLRAEKSLWLPYGVHLGVNLSFSLSGWFFITRPNAAQWWLGHPTWSPESGLLGVVGWLLLVLVIYSLTGNDRLNRLMPGK